MKISFEKEITGADHHERIGLAFTYGYYFHEDRVFGVNLFWNCTSYWFAITITKVLTKFNCSRCGSALLEDDVVWVDEEGSANMNGDPYCVSCAPKEEFYYEEEEEL